MSPNSVSLDSILIEIGGFGKFQRVVVLLILIAASTINIPALVWVFETKEVNYRCELPGCESNPPQYKSSWWSDAIPSVDNTPSKCEKYKRLVNNNQITSCEFDRNVTEHCDAYVYETDEISIVQDFNLHCEENLWKLTLVGTINSVGVFVGLPISGVLSDRIGRKLILVASVTLSGLCGLIRSFSNSYIFFILMQFIDSVFRAATYPTCFILDQILYGMCLIVLSWYWLLPESIRWLLAEKKYTDAANLLKRIAKTNGTTISEEKLSELWNSSITPNSAGRKHSFKEIFNSSIITKRFINCSICWTICMFCYYGMTFISVNLSSNSYLDFILTILVEIPSSVAAYLLIDRIGRRYSLALGFFVCGVSCLSFICIPEDLYWLKLSMYLLGKFGISINVTGLYTLTSEMFPTPLRSSLLSICSTFGRLGVMTAPQLPLLKLYWEPFPLTLFVSTAFIAGVLSLLFPETMNTTLPDTIKEAEKIGKKGRTESESTLCNSEEVPKRITVVNEVVKY
ncbi:hypothetical protein RI129_001520 [Pyrocoelia pectoralis]|uniref:Organic cation transporter n=1 Tax=Pyrocoelia pectoralis TaxID=417401 RepID=A0AAN7VUY9_9COLE